MGTALQSRVGNYNVLEMKLDKSHFRVEFIHLASSNSWMKIAPRVQ